MNVLFYQPIKNQTDNCTLIKAEMKRCCLTEADMAKQLEISIRMLRQYLQSGFGPQYVEKRVKEWLE